MYNFDKLLLLTNIALFMSGININKTKLNPVINVFANNFLFYCNLLWLYTDVFAEFYWLVDGVQIGKNILELSLVAPCTTICLLATAKSTPVYFKRQLLINIIDKLKELHEEIKNYDEVQKDHAVNKIDEKVKEIVNESISLFKFVILLLFSSSVFVVTVFSFMPITLMGYDYYAKGEYEVKFPFLVKYFFDPFTEGRWPFVYIHQVWSTCIACVNVYGPDTFLYAFCVYVQMHFRILSHRLENVISRKTISLEEKGHFYQLLKRHQELIELVQNFDGLYSGSNLFNIMTSSLLICLSGFNITTNPDAGAVIAFVSFLFLSISQISILCFFGDMIVSSSSQVAQAAYNCRWYCADEELKKSLFIVINRARQPCKLTAAKFANLNLQTFAKIISRSWSYFALLKTMYK